VEQLGDFDNMQSLLNAHDSYMSAAEVHGLASGMLCVGFDAKFDRWVVAVFETDEQLEGLDDNEKSDLISLFEGTCELLKSDEFIFDLFLPDDGVPMAERAKALSEWCQGFLYGIAYMGANDDTDWGEEGRGILRDFLELSRIDADGAEEADEQSYMELQEYVRSAVHVMLMELQPAVEANTTTSPRLH
jgi:uncharacterized protein YgfB (UPF0149 family)